MFSIENNANQSLLVYKVIDNDNIDSFSKGMLSNIGTKQILAPSYSQNDEEIFLKYQITSKIKLSLFLKDEQKKENVLNILKSLAIVIIELENNILDTNKLIFDFEYIYIDITTFETFFVYLPIKDYDNKISYKDFIRKVLSYSIYSQEEDNTYLIDIFNYINKNKDMTITDFKNFIINMQKNININKVNPLINTKDKINENNNIINTKEDNINNIENKVVDKNIANKDILNKDILNKANELNNLNIPKRTKQKETKNSFLNFGKKKEKKPFFSFGKSKKEILYTDENGKYISNSLNVAVPNISMPNKENINKNANKVINKNNIENNSFVGSSDDENKTVILGGSDSNRTVMLGKDTINNQNVNIAKLIRRNTREIFDITKNEIKIGKLASYVDFCIGDNNAISNFHAMIYKDNNDYYLVDVNSVNHTYLDNTMLMPDTPQKLENGSIIKFANEECEFRL